LRYRRSDGRLFTGSTSKLWPFSEITAGVVVLNGAEEGDISNTVTFDTPQGGKLISSVIIQNLFCCVSLSLHVFCLKMFQLVFILWMSDVCFYQ